MEIQERITEYITGMESQLIEMQKQAHMLEGAIGFAKQLMDDLEKEEAGGEQSPPEEHEN